MYFNPSDDQDIAGILLFKDEDHHIFFAIQGIENEKEIKIEQISGTDRKVLAKGIVSIQKDQAIDLKVVSNGTNYDFYYNVDDNNWQLLALGVSAQNLSTANAGGFTGTTIGLYATKDKQ